MKIVSSWLEDFMDKPLAAQEVVAALEQGGIEVEGILRPVELDTRIIVAEVVELDPHPDAERLKVALVDTGTQQVQVVCGAPNIALRQKVALAQAGVKLPDGMAISKAKLRGVVSHGMLCSARELSLGEDHEGILVLDPKLENGVSLQDVYGRDTVIDITPAHNRPDLQGIVGIAREVAARTEAKLTVPKAKEVRALPAKTLFVNEIPQRVFRYSLARIKLGKKVGPSPDWLKNRLALSGIRSVNTVVDITNYCMLETGQPLHAFDAAKIGGKLTVRLAHSDETITTLDGVQRTLSPHDIVIASELNAVALAGVMGGEGSEVTDATTQILLESATFEAANIRKTALRHGLRTEASTRFEKMLPLGFVTDGMQRALELLGSECSASLEIVEDELQNVPKPTQILINTAKFSKLAGTEISKEQTRKSLVSLGFELKEQSKGMSVLVPYWRTDIALPEDVFEEVIKAVGLDSIPATLPKFNPQKTTVDQFWPKLWKIRDALWGLGLIEVTTYPFVSGQQLDQLGLKPADHLKLQNPRSTEQSYLRKSLLPNMLTAVRNNSRTEKTFGLFEIGKVYAPSADYLPDEPLKLAAIVQDSEAAYRTLKNILDQLIESLHLSISLRPTRQREYMHPARHADVFLDELNLGYIGELHPVLLQRFKINESVSYMELSLGPILERWGQPAFRPLSRYQSSFRDVTFILDWHINWQDIVQALDFPEVIATYKGDFYGKGVPQGRRALTIGLEVFSYQKTLTEKEVESQVAAVTSRLKQSFGAEVKD